MATCKQVILITGTPCVGKTSVAKALASRLNALYVNLTELVLDEDLVAGKDEERDTMAIDATQVRRRIKEILMDCKEENVVIDGHYATLVVPKTHVTHVFVLRRDPAELKKFMEERSFLGRKLWENLASEILDVCLTDALKVHGKEKVCEVDVTGRSVENVVDEILHVLDKRLKCRVGIVDWLGKLEREGVLDEYLRF